MYEHFIVNHSAGEYQREQDTGGGEIVGAHCNTLKALARRCEPRKING